MIKEKYLNSLTDIDIVEIVNKVNSLLGILKKNNNILREEIFNILESNSKTLYYPIESDQICGFVYQFKEYKFAYVNSYLPLQKQIFAAAHELYHILYSDISKGELLESSVLDETIKYENLKKEDLKANRFAAEILIPEEILKTELRRIKASEKNITISDIVCLMDVFLVSHKTIIRRLYEVKIINYSQYLIFIKTDIIDIELQKKRLGVALRNNTRTHIKKLDKLVDMSLSLYEKNIITYEKLEYLLSLADSTTLEFNIYEKKEDRKSVV